MTSQSDAAADAEWARWTQGDSASHHGKLDSNSIPSSPSHLWPEDHNQPHEAPWGVWRTRSTQGSVESSPARLNAKSQSRHAEKPRSVRDSASWKAIETTSSNLQHATLSHFMHSQSSRATRPSEKAAPVRPSSPTRSDCSSDHSFHTTLTSLAPAPRGIGMVKAAGMQVSPSRTEVPSVTQSPGHHVAMIQRARDPWSWYTQTQADTPRSATHLPYDGYDRLHDARLSSEDDPPPYAEAIEGKRGYVEDTGKGNGKGKAKATPAPSLESGGNGWNTYSQAGPSSQRFQTSSRLPYEYTPSWCESCGKPFASEVDLRLHTKYDSCQQQEQRRQPNNRLSPMAGHLTLTDERDHNDSKRDMLPRLRPENDAYNPSQSQVKHTAPIDAPIFMPAPRCFCYDRYQTFCEKCRRHFPTHDKLYRHLCNAREHLYFCRSCSTDYDRFSDYQMHIAQNVPCRPVDTIYGARSLLQIWADHQKDVQRIKRTEAYARQRQSSDHHSGSRCLDGGTAAASSMSHSRDLSSRPELDARRWWHAPPSQLSPELGLMEALKKLSARTESDIDDIPPLALEEAPPSSLVKPKFVVPGLPAPLEPSSPRHRSKKKSSNESTGSHAAATDARSLADENTAQRDNTQSDKQALSSRCMPSIVDEKRTSAPPVKRITTAPECAICISPLWRKGEVLATACGHVFCGPCILQYIRNTKAECPICRTPLNTSMIIPLHLH